MNNSPSNKTNTDHMPEFQIYSFNVITDTILFYYERPILCLCKTPRDQYYLAYSYEPDNQAWILAQVSRAALIDMFNNKVSMDSVMQGSSEKWIGVEGKLFKKTDTFNKDELPKKDAFYGKVSSLELGLLNRLASEDAAIKSGKVFFTKAQLIEAIKDLDDGDRVQVQVNYSCEVDSIADTGHFKGTNSCERVTGVGIRKYRAASGELVKIAEINCEVSIF